MLIIGCDYHPSMQQIAWWDSQSGERGERRLEHSSGEAERFYRELKQRAVAVRVGIEACGHTLWFERLLAELQMELWIGNPAKIAAQRVRKQKTDRGDAQHLLSKALAAKFAMVVAKDAKKPEPLSEVGKKFGKSPQNFLRIGK
jgi:transposase